MLYTEQMGDEKRDTVEYTSEGFLGCEHTMLTYTRAMDSALCARARARVRVRVRVRASYA